GTLLGRPADPASRRLPCPPGGGWLAAARFGRRRDGGGTRSPRDLVAEGAAAELDQGDASRREALGEILCRELRLQHLAAREHVYRGEAVLGPGVDGEVRLGDHHHAAHPERAELVEHVVHYRGTGAVGRFEHRGLHGGEARQGGSVALEELEEEMTPERLHAHRFHRSTVSPAWPGRACGAVDR